MENMIKRYLAEDAQGVKAEYTFEIIQGPAFMGGNAKLVMIERGSEFLKMVDISHDDWALDDFNLWCTEYMERALKVRVLEDISRLRRDPVNRLREKGN